MFFVPALISAKVIEWVAVNQSKLQSEGFNGLFKFGDIVKYKDELFIYTSPRYVVKLPEKGVSSDISPMTDQTKSKASFPTISNDISAVAISIKAVDKSSITNQTESLVVQQTTSNVETSINAIERRLLVEDSEVTPTDSYGWKKLSDYVSDLNLKIDPLDWDEDYIQTVIHKFCESFNASAYNSSLSDIYRNRFHYGLYDANDTNKEFKSLFSEEFHDARFWGKKLAEDKLQTKPSELNLLKSEKYAEEVFKIASAQNLNIHAYSSGWFYIAGTGWLYTNPQIFPYFYLSDSASILRYCNTEKGHMFLDTTSMVWVSFDKKSLFPIAPFWDLDFYGEELTLDSLNDPTTTPFKYIDDTLSNATFLDPNLVSKSLNNHDIGKLDSLGTWLKKFSLKSGVKTNLNDLKGTISDPIKMVTDVGLGALTSISLSDSEMYEFLVNDAKEKPSYYKLRKVADIDDKDKADFLDKAKEESLSSESQRYQTIALDGDSKYFFEEAFSEGGIPNHTRYVHTEVIGEMIFKETVYLHTDYLDVFSNLEDHVCHKPYTNGWYYTPEDGWLWTNDETFPFIFRHKDGGWLYFYVSDEKSFFFDYNKNSVVNLNN